MLPRKACVTLASSFSPLNPPPLQPGWVARGSCGPSPGQVSPCLGPAHTAHLPARGPAGPGPVLGVLPLPVILGSPSAACRPWPALLRPALRSAGPRYRVHMGGVIPVATAVSGASPGATLGTRPEPQLCHLHYDLGQRHRIFLGLCLLVWKWEYHHLLARAAVKSEGGHVGAAHSVMSSLPILSLVGDRHSSFRETPALV